ncbi:hypothetical protein V493_03751 [Pseudogymnoascus sp. VKM F-4281 (FW-2241)]|nr:hypothetical protein V493_03751 [Pseudogymnoascus sp. VKM F-4281 (FW-2241)]
MKERAVVPASGYTLRSAKNPISEGPQTSKPPSKRSIEHYLQFRVRSASLYGESQPAAVDDEEPPAGQDPAESQGQQSRPYIT